MALPTTTLGTLLSLFAAATWAITPVVYGSISRRVGTWPANLLRLAVGAVLLAAVAGAYWAALGGRVILPTWQQAAWLYASALAGMVLGDWAMFEAILTLGPRRTVQFETLAPVSSVIVGWVWLGEALPARVLLGATMVLCGISFAVFAERADAASREPGRVSLAGIVWAVLAGVGMGLGAVFARRALRSEPGMARVDPLLATAIRVVSATLTLWIIAAFLGTAAAAGRAWSDPAVRWRTVAVGLMGPGVAMIAYITALGLAPAGLVSTLVALSPLLTVPVVSLRYRTKVPRRVVVAMVVAVAGVVLISLR